MDRGNYFKEGGSGVLLIPSSLGYGSSTRGPIQEVQYLFLILN
jgi:FKBP-type peptidyl-prolyl cis-trans isomerase